MKTYMAKANEVDRKWYLFDAQEEVLGRMAVKAATMLQGKNKPIYTPHCDTGDFVVIVNAEKVLITGNKKDQRMIRWHSGYIGGLKEVSVRRFLEKKPEELIRLAVRRMLPKTKLGHQMITKLKIYKGPDHPHQAQDPKKIATAKA
ncbi:MAG: 50S ribosomal protein L13 [Planctomycetota bacterium]